MGWSRVKAGAGATMLASLLLCVGAYQYATVQADDVGPNSGSGVVVSRESGSGRRVRSLTGSLPRKNPSSKFQASDMAGADFDFDLKKINEHFLRVLELKEGETTPSLDIEEYVLAFQELTKFVEILGKLFHFVYTDLRSKNQILADYKKEDSVHYSTIRAMLDYEVEKDLTQNPDRASGSRTLLRLHRALEYLVGFFRNLHTSPLDNTGCSTLSLDAYNASLANYHPFLVRNGARLAMYALPNKLDLLEQMNQGQVKYTAEEVVAILGDVSKNGQALWEAAEAMFKERNLLELP